jgi:hypothetical protein
MRESRILFPNTLGVRGSAARPLLNKMAMIKNVVENLSDFKIREALFI